MLQRGTIRLAASWLNEPASPWIATRMLTRSQSYITPSMRALAVAHGLYYNSTPGSHMKKTLQVVLSFLEAINTHHVDAICAHMTEDHVFVDGLGSKLTGTANM